MFRFDCTFSNFNCTKRVQLHTILRPDVSTEQMAPRTSHGRSTATAGGAVGCD